MDWTQEAAESHRLSATSVRGSDRSVELLSSSQGLFFFAVESKSRKSLSSPSLLSSPVVTSPFIWLCKLQVKVFPWDCPRHI